MTLVTRIGPISKWRYNAGFVKMAITQDGLSQLLSSYASDESEGSSSEEEDTAGKDKQTIESVKGKGNPHKADDAGCKDCSKIQRLAIKCDLSPSFHVLPYPVIRLYIGRYKTVDWLRSNWLCIDQIETLTYSPRFLHIFIFPFCTERYYHFLEEYLTCLKKVNKMKIFCLFCKIKKFHFINQPFQNLCIELE